jgi:hypothetical protein
MASTAREDRTRDASSTERQAPVAAAFNPTEWMHWREALACGAKVTGDTYTAGRELDAKRRSGEIRAVARYSAPDGAVEWRKLPDDIEITVVSDYKNAYSKEWTEEQRRGGSYTLWVRRTDVERLWDLPITPTGGPNPRGAGRKPKYDPEFIRNEAWAHAYENGLPGSLEGLVHDLQLKLGGRMPEDSQAKKLLRPVFERMEQLREQLGERRR